MEQIRNSINERKDQGNNVVTTLNVELQQTAYSALGNSRGAVVVLEAETGKVLAMVSKPDFDPGTINEDWESLTSEDDTDSALYNRASQGLYPPGSTFKIVTLLEYMRENPDYADFSFRCSGSLTEGNYTINCYGGTSHGQEDLTEAFARSCNSAFASIGPVSYTHLDQTDRLILNTMIEKFTGGPVGLDTLAAAIGEDAGTIEDVYEPYLIKRGFINRTPRGRVVTELGYRHLGVVQGG